MLLVLGILEDMKIVFTGGGTGGHFYPIIAVAEEIHEIVQEEKLLSPELYYIGPSVLDYEALSEQNITWKKRMIFFRFRSLLH